MKFDCPNDLQGRLIKCQKRARMIASSLDAIAHCVGDIEPNPDALAALGEVADELADALDALEAAYVDEANVDYAEIQALKARAATVTVQ